MINQHAIRLTEKNLESIIHETNASRGALVEMLEESLQQGMPYYIVANRLSSDGLLRWETMTQVEFSIEFNIGNTNPYDNHWKRV